MSKRNVITISGPVMSHISVAGELSMATINQADHIELRLDKTATEELVAFILAVYVEAERIERNGLQQL